MKNIENAIYIAVFVTLCSFTSILNKPQGGTTVVIVNKDNPAATLSASEVKLYYTRKLKSRWPEINKFIKPVTRKSKCEVRDNFYGTILKMADAEVDNYFAERQFQNAEKQPDKLNSDADIVNFVEQEIGAIGFISSAAATSEVRSRVKVVLEF